VAATPEPAPVVAAAPAAAAPPTAIAATAVAASPAAPAAAPRIELPSSNAAYLNNPKPAYPALSRRLGEQGKVVVRVLIGVDGKAQQAEIRSSSGYDRLDQAALATVRSWRYVPGTRNGIPEAMWFNVPINFVLE
jgi:protein TonB